MTIIKVGVGLFVLALAFFVFCMRSGGDDFELNKSSDEEISVEAKGPFSKRLQSQCENGERSKDEFKIGGGADPDKVVEENKNIYVDISGAVEKPNVYKLKSGARVYELIKKAGGLKAGAYTQNINLAGILKDQDKIVILTEEEAEAENAKALEGKTPITGTGMSASTAGYENAGNVTSANAGNSSASGMIDLNSATKEELETIKGIGPSMAQRILTYRNENGKFSRIEDLMNVKGIGEKTFSKMREKIKV